MIIPKAPEIPREGKAEGAGQEKKARKKKRTKDRQNNFCNKVISVAIFDFYSFAVVKW